MGDCTDDILTGSLLDAASFPSIIDSILQEATYSYDVSALRLVCKDWKSRIDRDLARHVEVRDFWIQIGGLRPYFRGLLERADVGLAVRSCLRPGIHFGLSEPLYYSLDLGRDVLRELRPSYLYKMVEVLDYALGTDHIHPSLGLKLVQGFPNLHTIRLSVNFRNLQYIQHVDRVIFKDRPMWTIRDDPTSKVTCTPDCTWPHVRKIVVNVNLPDLRDTVMGGGPLPFDSSTGLEEVVLIFHAWMIIPDVLRDTGDDQPQDLRFTVRAIAAAAMVSGARVTVVNAEQRDLVSGEKTGNFPDAENADEELEYLIRQDLKHFGVGMFFGKPGQLRFLTTEEYVAQIGPREFEIESGARVGDY